MSWRQFATQCGDSKNLELRVSMRSVVVVVVVVVVVAAAAVVVVVMVVILFVGCLTSQQHASVPQGRICSDNFTCCHTEIKASD